MGSKASLRQGTDNLPNGLLGILLPNLSSIHLPERFVDSGIKNIKIMQDISSPTNVLNCELGLDTANQEKLGQIHKE